MGNQSLIQSEQVGEVSEQFHKVFPKISFLSHSQLITADDNKIHFMFHSWSSNFSTNNVD